ncbi:MAG: hypothetical protein ISS52_01455 [Dehalococcoidia bacterium]|nr:hypothetical protein [Dehalococcoidia bacterium]
MSNTHVTYELTIREFEAIAGTRKVLTRNSRNLEVKIPPMVTAGTMVRLRNALDTTDGCPGDILVRIRIAPTQDANPSAGTDIRLIFETCLHDIGGRTNPDVQRYVDLRSSPKPITRPLFFERAVWAVWVSGMSRKATKGFMNKNAGEISRLDYQAFSRLDTESLKGFMEKLHGRPVPPRAQKKWHAVHRIANWLSGFPSDESFCNGVFQGKRQGSHLDKTDIDTLRSQRLPFIREPNANYVVKNLAGEAIKVERWVKALLTWGGITIDQLEAQLHIFHIPLSFFDTVFWSYCEMHIRRVHLFDVHFATKFGHLDLIP